MSNTFSITQLHRGGGKRDADGSAIVEAAKRIGCDLYLLHAILEVESRGHPFDDKGRLIILPEKHIFWRLLPKGLRARAKRLGLAVPKWSRQNYAGLGRSGSNARWQRLAQMVSLHEEAALKSASYGKPQLMGFNYAKCGFSTVQKFVFALAQSEAAQDKAFIAFLENSGLANDLRDGDVRSIVRRYNGPGQVERYTRLIEKAYRRLTGHSNFERNKARAHSLRLGSEGDKVRKLQTRLNNLGYHLRIDGDFGPATRRAVVAFQNDNGLKVDGIAGFKTQTALQNAVPIQQETSIVHDVNGEAVAVTPQRSKEGLTDLQRNGSRIADASIKGVGTGATGAGFGMLVMLAEFSELFQETLQTLDPIFEPFGGLSRFALLLLMAVVAFMTWQHWRAGSARVEDHRSGKTV